MTKPQIPFIPNVGERALIVGQTGSGKTAFAAWLLVRFPNAPIIIYDTKDENKFLKLPNHVVVYTQEQCSEEIDNPEIDYIIYRPPDEMLGKPEELDNLLYYHYMNYRNVVAYIDELYTFHNNGRAYKGLIALYSRGRSKGITTIGCSQRPAMISRLAITEAQKIFVFKLGDRQDRKRMSDVIPNFADMPLPDTHGFYFFNSGDDTPELFKPIKLDPSLNTGYVDIPTIETSEVSEDENKSGTKHVWV